MLECRTTLNKRLAFATIRETTELIRNGTITPLDLVRESARRMDYLKLYNLGISSTPLEVEAATLEEDHCRIEDDPDAVVFTCVIKESAPSSMEPKGSQSCSVSTQEDTILGRIALQNGGGICVGHSTPSGPIGQTRNPHDPELAIGGPCGGSAGAVASGICHVAIEADSSPGAIACAASFAGTVGVKLTIQPLLPSKPLQPDFDHLSKGFFTRNVEDAAVVLDVLSHHQHDFLAASLDGSCADERSPLAGKRIAYLPTFDYIQLDKQVASAVEKAVRSLPLFLNITQVRTLGFDDNGITIKTLLHADFQDRLSGQALRSATVAEAYKTRDEVVARIEAFFADYDFLITPAMPATPWRRTDDGHDRDAAHHLAFACPFDWSGNPSVVLPCGTTTGVLHPLPVGLQIVMGGKRLARHREEEDERIQGVRDLLRLSALCERAFAYDHWPIFGALDYDYGPPSGN